jgi:hypothetical protein
MVLARVNLLVLMHMKEELMRKLEGRAIDVIFSNNDTVYSLCPSLIVAEETWW